MAVVIPDEIKNRPRVGGNTIRTKPTKIGNVVIPGNEDIAVQKTPDKNGFIRTTGKEIVKGIFTPVVKTALFTRRRLGAENPLNALLKENLDFEETLAIDLPLLGRVEEPQSAREAVGAAIQTALLPVGGTAIKGAGLAAKAGIGAAVGGGFGLGAGLEEERRGKELILPTALGAGFGAALAPIFAAGGKAIRAGAAKIPFEKLKGGVTQGFSKLADTSPVKFISSVSARLKRLGEPGKKIVKGFEDIDKEKLLRTGAAIDNLDDAGFRRLTSRESLLLQDAFEGRITRAQLPKTTQRIFDTFDNLRNEIADEANKVGLKTRLQKGIEVPFQGRRNFFPHFIPRAENLKKGGST